MANGICDGSSLCIRSITMRRARTWGWARMRRYDDPSNDLGPSSPHQSCPDCIIATRGYDFREGQEARRGTVSPCSCSKFKIEVSRVKFPVPRKIFPDTRLEFPVPLSREFWFKPLNWRADWVPKSQPHPRIRKIPCYFPC